MSPCERKVGAALATLSAVAMMMAMFLWMGRPTHEQAEPASGGRLADIAPVARVAPDLRSADIDGAGPLVLPDTHGHETLALPPLALNPDLNPPAGKWF